MLVHMEIPGMSLNLQDPLLRLTGIHPRQTGGIPIGQVFTDCARDGGVQPIRLPGSGTGLVTFEPQSYNKCILNKPPTNCVYGQVNCCVVTL